MTDSTSKTSVSRATPDLADLLEDALHQAKSLVQAEFSLARRELMSELKTTSGLLIWLAFGLMFLQAALTTLGVLLVLALGVRLASLAVVAGLAVLGAAAVVYARQALAQRSLARTTARVALDAKQVMETVK